MDGAARRIGGQIRPLIAGAPHHIQQSTEHGLAYRHLQRSPGQARGGAAGDALGGLQGDDAHALLVQMGLHLGHDDAVARVDLHGFVDGRQRPVDAQIEYRSANRDHVGGRWRHG